MSSSQTLTFATQSHIPLIVGGCAASTFFLGASSLPVVFDVRLSNVIFSSLDEGTDGKMWLALNGEVGCLLS